MYMCVCITCIRDVVYKNRVMGFIFLIFVRLQTGKENAIKDREERLRMVREKHDEERQRKLEELKQQVMYFLRSVYQQNLYETYNALA